MAFLDNSGDIILDAVLTDTGRYRLAKGDGSFKIVKFALGDDEINYGSYNKNNSSGSAYYDLEILQTPILEAFTNNTSTMKSRLISIARTNLLYLPVLKLGGGDLSRTSGGAFTGSFWCAVDQNTAGQENIITGLIEKDNGTVTEDIKGRLDGYDPFGATAGDSNFIRVDQGLDTTEISSDYTIDADLTETQYIIEIDNRFGTIVSGPNFVQGNTGVAANISFIDDDNIASYYLSINTDTNFIANLPNNASSTTIQGPRGTYLEFRIQASTDLQTSTYLFTQLGSTLQQQDLGGGSANTYYYIDTIIKVTGATTGYRLDIPVRFLKKQV